MNLFQFLSFFPLLLLILAGPSRHEHKNSSEKAIVPARSFPPSYQALTIEEKMVKKAKAAFLLDSQSLSTQIQLTKAKHDNSFHWIDKFGKKRIASNSFLMKLEGDFEVERASWGAEGDVISSNQLKMTKTVYNPFGRRLF